MKFILFEAKITDASTEREILDNLNSDTKEGRNKAYDAIISILEKNYPEAYKHINAPGDNNYLSKVLNSVDEYGLDTSRNQFLGFALSKDNTFDVSNEQADLLYNCFKNKSLTQDADWLHNPQAYDGDSLFKLKTLIFLSSDKSKSYGENPQDIKKEILSLQKDKDIQRVLNGWSQDDSKKVRDIYDVQKLVDADLKKYKEIQPITLRSIDEAGYQLLTDKYGNLVPALKSK